MGKAYRIPSARDRLKKHQTNIKELEAQFRNRNTPRSVAATAFSGVSAAGDTGGGTGNFLSIEGGTMNANIAFEPNVILVSGGRVDLDPGSTDPNNSSYILVAGQGTPDDIRFIDGAEREGQFLIYQGANQQVQNIINANLLSISNIVGDGSTTITVTLSNTGTLANGSSINVIGTNNFDITGGIVAGLVVNTSFTYQRTAGASTTAESFATIQDGNILTNDGNNIALDGTLSLNGAPQMLLIFDSSAPGGAWRVISTNIAGGGSVNWSDVVIDTNKDMLGFNLTNLGNIIIKNTQTDGSPANLILERNDTTPLDGDTVGNIFYNGPTDTAAVATWGAIDVDSQDVSNSAKQGELTISVQHDNTLTPILNYTGADATLRISTGIDVLRPNANGTKELGTSSFFWDDVFSETFTLRGSGGNTSGSDRTVYADSAGMVFNMPSSAPVFTHSVNNEIFSLLSNGNFEIRTELNNGPTLQLRNNDQTPNDNDTAATILFNGEDSAGAERTYGAIVTKMDDVTSTSLQGDMEIRVVSDNTIAPILDYTGADKTLRLSTNADVFRPNANGTKELGTSSFFWDDVFSETFTLRGSGGNTSTSARTIRADGLNMIFNMPSGDGFLHAIAGNIKSLLSDGELEIRTALSNGPTLRLRNDDQTPTDNDTAAAILFTGENSAGSESTYGAIDVSMDDVTSTSLQADMTFKAQESNSLKTWMNFLGASDKINMFSFLDMNSNYIEFDDRTVPAAPAATERILFSDSTNSAHLSIRTDTRTIDLETSVIRATKSASTTLNNATTSTEIVFNVEDFNTDTDSFVLDADDRIECKFTGHVLVVIQATMTQTSVVTANNQIIVRVQESGSTISGLQVVFSSPNALNSKMANVYSVVVPVTINDALSFGLVRLGDSTGNTYQTALTNGFKMSVQKL